MASAEESEKARAFFENALRLLAGPRIAVLQIADHNTTGVIGPCVNGKPFFAMMKATGQSKKSETATGSYGIGKFAVHCVGTAHRVSDDGMAGRGWKPIPLCTGQVDPHVAPRRRGCH